MSFLSLHDNRSWINHPNCPNKLKNILKSMLKNMKFNILKNMIIFDKIF